MTNKNRVYIPDGAEIEIKRPSFIYNAHKNIYTILVHDRPRDVRYMGRPVRYDDQQKPYIEVEALDVTA